MEMFRSLTECWFHSEVTVKLWGSGMKCHGLKSKCLSEASIRTLDL